MSVISSIRLKLQPSRGVLDECHALLDRVNNLEERFRGLDDHSLRDGFLAMRNHLRDGVLPTAYLPEAFARVREACRRAVGMRPYDVQVLAGMILARGCIAEMATGEGKTLTATLPVAVHALSGRGVHVATVNAYLAERDHGLMKPVFRLLGLSSALLAERIPPEMKRKAYAADITYGTGYEFGFDFLRDQLSLIGAGKARYGDLWCKRILGETMKEASPGMQRPFAFALVDEIDSVLIDEAVTPLIISGAAAKGENPAAALYRSADRVAARLTPDTDFVLDESSQRVALARKGLQTVYETLPDSLHGLLRRAWHEHVEDALRARLTLHRDVHYLLRKGAVEIIDSNTGRSFPDRKWRGGLHQAVEAKEQVLVTHETVSEVSISRQRFYKLYPLLAGMTGTAMEQKTEFRSAYKLETVPVPLNRPSQRTGLPPRIFVSSSAMIQAVLAETMACVAMKRPVLIGTRSVRRSDEIADAFAVAGIDVTLLNARQDAQEAEVIALAGQARRITIATNMAGRGADIPLGPGVAECGGLHVIGVEFNDARRINRQLVGRCARQGDPGSCRFFLSLDDHILMHVKRPEAGIPEGELSARYLNGFQKAMLGAEKKAFRMRCAVMAADKWLDSLKQNI